jgi:hypothetical protein
MPRVRNVGTVMVVLGGALLVCALAFLPYFEARRGVHVFGGSSEATLWDLTTREPFILTALASAAIALAAASLLIDAAPLQAVTLALTFYLLGRAFPTGAARYQIYGVGFWLTTAAAAAMAAGALLATVGSVLPRASAKRLATPA